MAGASPSLADLHTDEDRWAAVVRRDGDADGAFVFSVRTTGVYCRPSCGARRARRENVAFHRSVADAERAGFRPCKRCRPDEAPLAERRAAAVTAACRLIEAAEEAPTLETLAREVGMSAYHFHRVFKQATGVTPRAYAEARRGNRVRAALAEGGSVTDAVYAAGYGSSGRFYDGAASVLGMSPGAFRRGGAGEAIRFAVGGSALGAVLVAASERGVCAIDLGDDPEALVRGLRERFPAAVLVEDDPGFGELVDRVVAFVEEPRGALDLPLDTRGTAFQRRVWEALRAIPAGETASYAEVAARVGVPGAARAVAGACAANGLAVAIPCHRVVRGDGALAGYRWGTERKRTLLTREGVATSAKPV